MINLWDNKVTKLRPYYQDIYFNYQGSLWQAEELKTGKNYQPSDQQSSLAYKNIGFIQWQKYNSGLNALLMN